MTVTFKVQPDKRRMSTPESINFEFLNDDFMIVSLKKVLGVLPALIERRDTWKSIDVDYEPPRVERVWRDVDMADGDIPYGMRVCLHRIHACKEALYHPHPWPSAMLVLDGVYEMRVGLATKIEQGKPAEPHPHRATTLHLTKECVYAMTNPSAWHSVRPLTDTALSMMIMGKPYQGQPYDHAEFGKGRKFETLSDLAVDDILGTFWSKLHERPTRRVPAQARGGGGGRRRRRARKAG